MLNFLNNNNLKFKKIANDFQLIINDANDLKQIINIDPTLWAVTSLPINNVVFNYDFLTYMDFDKNQKIHPIQFITALKWLFDILIKYDGITTSSDKISLTNLNKDNFQYKQIAYTTRLINTQLKLKPKNIINLQTVLNYKIDNIEDQLFIAGYNNLKKLLLYQKYMIQFANNYINLDSLYNPNMLSIMQPGYLIMDGNYYTLGAIVENIHQHKEIIKRSNICTIYVEITSNNQKKLLAFAITYGLKQNLYIGKTGIYISRKDNSQWDAKIIDIIQQPISICQAVLSPFYKIHDMILNHVQKKIKSSEHLQITNQPKLKQKSKHTQYVMQSSNNNGLAINGLSIAALGSALAFILSSIKNISLITVFKVILSLFLLISIPIIIYTFYKLKNRSITDFYTASGWSINTKIKLSTKMGILFTYSPKKVIIMKIVKDDLMSKFIKEIIGKHYYYKKIYIYCSIIFIILALLCFGYFYFF